MPGAANGVVDRAAADACCAALPGAHMVVQWGGAHVWKVGPKVFAIISRNGSTGADRISLKASELSFQVLTDTPDVVPAPHLGRYKWVQFQKPDDDVAAYIEASHALVAAKLTKAQRRDAGL